MEDGRSQKAVKVPSEAPPPTVAGGYDVGGAKISNQHGTPISQSDIAGLTCCKCSFLLRDPRQVINCGHRYCQQCIEQFTNGDDGPYRCVVDNEKFSKSEIRNDKGCLRDLLGLRVTCPTIPPCDWTGTLVEMEVHKDICQNAEVSCDFGCDTSVKRGYLSKHAAVCPKRLSSCQHCHKDIPLDSLQTHYLSCEEYPVTCDYCQKAISSRKKLPNHLEQDCDEYYMDCAHDGCTFKGRKSDMMNHVMTKHLIQSLEQIGRVRKNMISIEKENKCLRRELSDCQSTVSNLQVQVKMLITENQQKGVKIASLESIVEKLEKERDEKDLALVNGGNFGDAVERDGPGKTGEDLYGDDELLPSKYKLVDRSDLLYHPQDKGRFKALNAAPLREPVFSVTGVPDVSRPGVELSRVKQEVEVVQSSLRKLNDIVQATQDNQTRYGVAIDEIRLRQDVLDVKTTNGILIWKIPDIRRRYRDAIDRRTISLYSPPFYTSFHGYRMCIRTYLNGDGIGKGTHVSLFFVVMRSEHDNLLPWPFKQTVRFSLINQKNPSASITEAFVPDLKSPSFHKPENDMNIASGFPKFARQSMLTDENFTLGNMIYIKCQVDLTGLPVQ